MVLVTGGCASGKRTFARSLGYADADIADAVLDERAAICHVEQFVACFEGSIEELAERLADKELVICREMGCGPVPARAEDLELREKVGRLNTALAARATCVVRMVCGIPCVIKGQL